VMLRCLGGHTIGKRAPVKTGVCIQKNRYSLEQR
jgi:hypothetical protein